MAYDIDDYQKKYGNRPRPTPSPTGIDAWRRQTPAPSVTTRPKPKATNPLLDYLASLGRAQGEVNRNIGNAVSKGWGEFSKFGQQVADSPIYNWGNQDNSPVAAGTPGAKWKLNPYRGTPAGGQEPVGGGGLEGPRGFAEILAEVQAMLQAQGGGGGVSYDPLRSQARSQWEDADARTLAMYQQLQNSIGAEAGNLGKVYDEGVAATNAATQFANEQNAQSAQNVNSMVGQQANALGIQEAVANDINAGNLSGQDQVARAADTAARGQITSNLLGSGKVAALDFNSDLVGAAGLQGAMTRGTRLNELNRLLAGYDVAEQEANAQAQSSYASDQMDLAKYLFGQENENFQFGVSQQGKAEQEANDREYQLWKMGQGSNKPAPLSRKQAISQVLADMGLPEIPGPGDTRNEFFDLVRMYEGR